MKKTILDDGSYPYLTEGAELVGKPGIPALLDIDNTQVPKAMIPFEKIKKTDNKRQYVHFYMHDKYFSNVLTATSKYVDLLKEFDGVVTPDCTMLVGQAPCIQQTNTYFNRSVGFYLQKQGIPVIPNIRWSDESSFDYCFLGVPKHKIVCVSTHGCIRSKQDRKLWRVGMEEMLSVLEPTDVLVHGYMPDEVFERFYDYAAFHRYPSLFEQTHLKGEVS
jgi:hypothetical protein